MPIVIQLALKIFVLGKENYQKK